MDTPPSNDLTVHERFIQLNTKQVMQLVGTENRSTLWKYVKEEKLPKPRYIAKHRPLWRLGEVVDTFGQYLEPYDAAPRSFRGDKTAAPEPVKQKGSGAAARIRERLGLKKR